jgi:hypothetical protein
VFGTPVAANLNGFTKNIQTLARVNSNKIAAQGFRVSAENCIRFILVLLEF